MGLMARFTSMTQSGGEVFAVDTEELVEKSVSRLMQ